MRQLGLTSFPEQVRIVHIVPGEDLETRGRLTPLSAGSVFEHVRRDLLPSIAENLYGVLNPGGVVFIQIEPLYYSPFGSHLGRILREPWVHLLHDQNDIIRMMNETPEAETRTCHFTNRVTISLKSTSPKSFLL